MIWGGPPLFLETSISKKRWTFLGSKSTQGGAPPSAFFLTPSVLGDPKATAGQGFPMVDPYDPWDEWCIYLPGSSKGCWMDDKGCRKTPSLRVQTAPFGRCWYMNGWFSMVNLSKYASPMDILWDKTIPMAHEFRTTISYAQEAIFWMFLRYPSSPIWQSKSKL